MNAGSSSLKLRLLDDTDRVIAGTDAAAADDAAIREFVDECGRVDAVGHRVVHGGHRFVEPVLVDAAVLAELEELVPLAPLHQPPALAAIRAVGERISDVPAIACFDTAFHAGLSPAASTYPVPAEWRERFGLRRFGFHGLSHAYVARRTPELLDAPVARLVTCHLGAGSSISAVVDGRCVDTTMGFTPNEGVPMATRSGSVDVGMLMWLLQSGVGPADLAEGLQHRSGLLGLAGTGDMREIEASARDGDERARLALDVWVHRVGQAIASMASSAGGVDAIAFTGGIGQSSASLRQEIAGRLAWLGVRLDDVANRGSGEDREVTASGGAVRVVVVDAREDIQIAQGARDALTR